MSNHVDLFDIKVQTGKKEFQIPGIDYFKKLYKHILFIPLSFSLLAGSTKYQNDNVIFGDASKT